MPSYPSHFWNEESERVQNRACEEEGATFEWIVNGLEAKWRHTLASSKSQEDTIVPPLQRTALSHLHKLRLWNPSIPLGSFRQFAACVAIFLSCILLTNPKRFAESVLPSSTSAFARCSERHTNFICLDLNLPRSSVKMSWRNGAFLKNIQTNFFVGHGSSRGKFEW